MTASIRFALLPVPDLKAWAALLTQGASCRRCPLVKTPPMTSTHRLPAWRLDGTASAPGIAWQDTHTSRNGVESAVLCSFLAGGLLTRANTSRTACRAAGGLFAHDALCKSCHAFGCETPLAEGTCRSNPACRLHACQGSCCSAAATECGPHRVAGQTQTQVRLTWQHWPSLVCARGK